MIANSTFNWLPLQWTRNEEAKKDGSHHDCWPFNERCWKFISINAWWSFWKACRSASLVIPSCFSAYLKWIQYLDIGSHTTYLIMFSFRISSADFSQGAKSNNIWMINTIVFSPFPCLFSLSWPVPCNVPKSLKLSTFCYKNVDNLL